MTRVIDGDAVFRFSPYKRHIEKKPNIGSHLSSCLTAPVAVETIVRPSKLIFPTYNATQYARLTPEGPETGMPHLSHKYPILVSA